MKNGQKKVLMVGPVPPQVGGMETFIYDLLNSSLKNHYKIVHLNTSKPLIKRRPIFKAPTGYAASFKRNILITAISYSYSFFFILKFIAILLRKHICIVHLHTIAYTSFWEKCPYILLAKLFRIRIVMHVHAPQFHDFYYGSNRMIRRLIRYFFSRCDAVVVLSDSWQKFFREFVDEKLLHIVPNGIDLAQYQPLEKYQEPTVVYLGELSQRKGIYDLLRAAVIIQSHGLAVRYHIIGPGEIDIATEVAQRLSIDNDMVFLGPKTGYEKSQLLGQSWLLVLPSYAEGLPIAVLEGMACGLPIVSTTVGGIPELIKNDVNGYLVKPGDVRELSDCIVKILNDRGLREQLCKNNIRDAGNFSIEICAERVDNIYKSLIY
jgi:glycosyltransferase involved in cell wall biosynthesis